MASKWCAELLQSITSMSAIPTLNNEDEEIFQEISAEVHEPLVTLLKSEAGKIQAVDNAVSLLEMSFGKCIRFYTILLPLERQKAIGLKLAKVLLSAIRLNNAIKDSEIKVYFEAFFELLRGDHRKVVIEMGNTDGQSGQGNEKPDLNTKFLVEDVTKEVKDILKAIDEATMPSSQEDRQALRRFVDLLAHTQPDGMGKHLKIIMERATRKKDTVKVVDSELAKEYFRISLSTTPTYIDIFWKNIAGQEHKTMAAAAGKVILVDAKKAVERNDLVDFFFAECWDLIQIARGIDPPVRQLEKKVISNFGLLGTQDRHQWSEAEVPLKCYPVLAREVGKLAGHAGEMFGLVLQRDMAEAMSCLKKFNAGISEDMERIKLVVGLENGRRNGWLLEGLGFSRDDYQRFFEGALQRFATEDEWKILHQLRVQSRR